MVVSLFYFFAFKDHISFFFGILIENILDHSFCLEAKDLSDACFHCADNHILRRLFVVNFDDNNLPNFEKELNDKGLSKVWVQVIPIDFGFKDFLPDLVGLS
jgi:hypothetical protein